MRSPPMVREVRRASGGWCCMKYAEVAVDAPLGVNRTLTYSIPPRMEVFPGQLVWVPLGPRPVQGMVFEVSDHTALDTTRPVISAIAPQRAAAVVGARTGPMVESLLSLVPLRGGDPYAAARVQDPPSRPCQNCTGTTFRPD